jgi:hypothetical protein
VFCFGEQKHADTFVKEFGGEPMHPGKRAAANVEHGERRSVYGEATKSQRLQLIKKFLYSRPHSCPCSYEQVSKTGIACPMWETSDLERLLVGLPRCPKCRTRMVIAAVEEGPKGFEHRSFECSSCAHREQNVIACDPTNTNALGWLTSGLHPPK